MDASDCCLVCASELHFSGVGPCGHADACSRCVSRLRFLLQDKRCVVCQQPVPQVYYTRFMGDYTNKIAPEEYPRLKDRTDLFYCAEVDGFFDDKKQYEEIKGLCGYTHPALATQAGPGRAPPSFSNLTAMKQFIESKCKLSFCEVCLTGRQVFVCEQLLYNKADLERHHKQGDASGAMSAENGFRGHPSCKFCRQRFYDSNELYRHMESSHEHCFICRRATPDKYVYYRHYKELEDHFRNDHHLCPHPDCLAKKFVVFTGEPEFRRHFAAEHGEDMTKAQRREALSIPIQLQFRPRDEEDPRMGRGAGGSNSNLLALERPGVVIGGGQGLPSRHGPRGGRQQGGMHHSTSEPQMAAALQASYDDANAGGDSELNSITFTTDDFPTIGSAHGGGSSGTGMRPVGLWGGYSVGPGGALRPTDFPALPSNAKGKKKGKAGAEGTLAERLVAGARPVRVINKAAATPSGVVGANYDAGGASSSAASVSLADAFPPLRSGSPAVPTYTPPPPAPAASSSGLSSVVAAPPRPSVPLMFTSSSGAGSSAASVTAPVASQAVPDLVQDFPSLGGASGNVYRPTSMPPPEGGSMSGFVSAPAPRYASTAARSGGVDVGSSYQPPAAPAAPVITAEDFPSLGQVAVALNSAARPSSAAPVAASPAKGAKKKGGAAASVSSGASSSNGNAAAAAAAAAIQTGGPSEQLKAANKALIEKIKRQLSDSQFAAFKQQSGQFMQGKIPAKEYHTDMVELGLLSLAAELAALCPSAERRTQLMEAHKAFLSSPAAHDALRLGGRWVPPEAAIAAAEAAEARSSWACGVCTLINAPDAGACEACGSAREAAGKGARPVSAALSRTADDFPSLASTVPARKSEPAQPKQTAQPQEQQQQGKGKGKAKPVKVLGMVGPGSGRQQQAQFPSAPPPSVWGQR